MRRPRSPFISRSYGPSRRLIAAALGAVVGVAGCGGTPAPPPAPATTAATQSAGSRRETQALLSNALALLKHRLEDPAALQLALVQINQYITRTVGAKELGLAPAVEAFIPEALRPAARRAHFEPVDGQHISTCFLFRDLARHIVREAPLDRQRADAIMTWVARNIALVPDVGDNGQARPPAAPFETLLRGFGTAYDRVGVFVALLKQLDIPAFLLCKTVADDRGNVGVSPWICGVLLDGQVYLYDQRLGLPVPGPGAKGVATLRQAASDPAVLAQMDAPPFRYDATAADCQGLAVWLLGSVEFWAPRMKLLQDQLVGQDRVVVFEDLVDLHHQIVAAMPEARGRVLLGPTGLRGPAVLPIPLIANPRLQAARWSHLAGRYEAALALYPRCRDRGTGPIPGLPPLPDNEDVFRLGREDATFWIGLCKLDQDDPSTALWWLRDQYLRHYPTGRWAAAARLAAADILAGQDKASEALTLYETASHLVLMDYGNALRARELRRRLGLTPKPWPHGPVDRPQGATTAPAATRPGTP